MRCDQILVPQAMQEKMLQSAHEGHPGIVRMKRQLRRTYWWLGQDQDVENFVKYCKACQDSEKAHKRAEVTEPPSNTNDGKPWSKVAIDVTGPFATAPYHQRFIVVVIDYHSKYPEVLLTGNMTSSTIIRWLKEVFARYGNPDILVSDNGTNFTSTEFSRFLRSRDILHWRTPNYDPQRNGLVEVFNRYLKYGIQTFAAARKQFAEGINELLANFRSTAPMPNGESPAKLLFGRDMRMNYEPRRILPMPTEYHATDPKGEPTIKGPYRKQSPDNGSKIATSTFQRNDWVRIRFPHVPKGMTPFSRPYRIIQVLGKNTFRLDDHKVWSSKNLVLHKRTPREILITPVHPTTGDQVRQPTLRRSQRTNKGVPPNRFRNESFSGGR